MKFFQWSSAPDVGGDPNAHEWAEFNLPSDFDGFAPEPARWDLAEGTTGLSPIYDADISE